MRIMTERRIEEIQKYAAAEAWESCLQAMQYVPYRQRDMRFHAVSLNLYEKLRQRQAYANHLGVLRGLAKTYYDGYLHRQKAVSHVTKQEYALRSCRYFSRVLRQERNLFDVYQYGILLYRVSHDRGIVTSGSERRAKRRHAMALFTEIIQAGQGHEEWQELVLRACYRYSQCVIDNVRQRSPFTDEMELLFPSAGNSLSARDQQEFQAASCCLALLRVSSARLYAPEQIQYVSGVLAELGSQYRVGAPEDKAFKRAEQYYTGACELVIGKASSTSAGLLAYTALLTLALRRRNRPSYEALWTRYGNVFSLSAGTSLLHDVRWHILAKDYAKAKALLTPYLFQSQPYPGFSLARAKALGLIVDMGLGKKIPIP